MNIDQETIEILARCTTSPCVVVLPPGQLDRKLCEKVNKVLVAAGGKWNKRTKAHEFAEDATDVIEQAVLTGAIRQEKQELGIFYTPPELARRAAGMLWINSCGLTLLEPSAGMGALAEAARDAAGEWAFDPTITCMDVKAEHVIACSRLGFKSLQADFLKEDPAAFPLFDGVIMNPPFAKGADALHVLHAMSFLKPGGRLVAIMSAAITFRTTGSYPALRQLLQHYGSIEVLPAGSFKESGTGVNTALVTFDKPAS